MAIMNNSIEAIMKPFTKIVTNLQTYKNRMDTDASINMAKAEEHTTLSKNAQAEADRAKKLIDKLEKLVSEE